MSDSIKKMKNMRDKKQTYILPLVMILLLSIQSMTTHAEPIIPNDPNMVVASWKALSMGSDSIEMETTVETAIDEAQNYLNQANKPGNSYMYGLAQAALTPWINKTRSTNSSTYPQLDFIWARILQHQHNFDEALLYLRSVQESNPNNIDAHLLIARLFIIKNDYVSARSSCSKLLGKSDLITASICLLEVTSFQGKLSDSYDQLKKIVQLSRVGDQKEVWSRQILSEMAIRLGKNQESDEWLNMSLDDKDLGFIIDWSDSKLRQNKHCEAFHSLSKLSKHLDYIEDALILRLAIAESRCESIEGSAWATSMKARVELREQRQDNHHASELAIYYLDLEPDASKALHWAKINWEQAKEYKDKIILGRASL